jgi:phosphoglycolate phosphatase
MTLQIYLDLDGTLTDPAPGITQCIRHALESLGECPPAAGDLHWCIGPPLLESFQTLVGPERAPRALAHYRQRFDRIGWQENSVYDGIPAALEALRQTGAALFVATSKPEVFARRIVDHFGLERYFNDVFGPELDGTRADKTELLRHARQGQSGPAVMVGDRRHDMIGAVNNGLVPVGVSWGYGSRQELLAAGAVRVIDSPGALAGLSA